MTIENQQESTGLVGAMTSENVSAQPVETQSPEPVTSEAPAQSGGNQQAERQRLITDMMGGNLRGDTLQEDYDDAPTVWEGALMYQADDGLANNLMEYVADAVQPNETPESRAEITQNLDVLRRDVPEEFWPEIESMATFDGANRKAELVRRRLNNERMLAKQGFVTGLGSGITGFVIDPTNLIPGAAILKVGNGAYKLGKAYKVTSKMLNKAVTPTTKFAGFVAAGVGEEMIRQVPRLEVDPTYSVDDYYFDAFVGGVFGGGLHLGMTGLKHLDDATFKIRDEVFSIENRMTVEKAGKITANIAKEAIDASKKKGFVEGVLNNPMDIMGKAIDQANFDIALKKIKLEPHALMKRLDSEEELTPEEVDMAITDSINNVVDNLRKTVGKDDEQLFDQAIGGLQKSLRDILQPEETKPKKDGGGDADLDADNAQDGLPEIKSEEKALIEASEKIDKALAEIDKFLQGEEVAGLYKVEGIYCEM